MKGRRTPYTEIGIRRMPCFRCGRKPSYASWSICADGNRYRPICADCDIDLNRMVLEWAMLGSPTTTPAERDECQRLLDDYERRVRG